MNHGLDHGLSRMVLDMLYLPSRYSLGVQATAKFSIVSG
jgi:hypothetical protein